MTSSVSRVTRWSGIAGRHAILIVLSMGALIPGYLMVVGSLKTQSDFLASPWALPVHLDLSAFAATMNLTFLTWMFNSVLVTSGAVALTMAVSMLAAWGLARTEFRGRDTLLAFTVSLMVVPPVVLMIPLFQFAAGLGWISTFRMIIIIYAGLMLPFSIYLLANFFQTLSKSLLEAASLDGANALQTFVYVVIPLSGPAIATLFVVNLMWAWNELLLALVFLQADDMKTLMVGITGFQGRYSLNVPIIMAGMIVATAPLLLAYIFGQRFLIRGLTMGGLKGE